MRFQGPVFICSYIFFLNQTLIIKVQIRYENSYRKRMPLDKALDQQNIDWKKSETPSACCRILSTIIPLGWFAWRINNEKIRKSHNVFGKSVYRIEDVNKNKLCKDSLNYQTHQALHFFRDIIFLVSSCWAPNSIFQKRKLQRYNFRIHFSNP